MDSRTILSPLRRIRPCAWDGDRGRSLPNRFLLKVYGKPYTISLPAASDHVLIVRTPIIDADSFDWQTGVAFLSSRAATQKDARERARSQWQPAE